MIAALPLFISQQQTTVVTGATGLIYPAYLLCNLGLFRARLGGWPARQAPFALGTWAMPVNLLAIIWGGALLVNFAWIRAASYGTNPPLGRGPSWLNDKPIFELLLVVIAVVGAGYYFLALRPRADTLPRGVRAAMQK